MSREAQAARDQVINEAIIKIKVTWPPFGSSEWQKWFNREGKAALKKAGASKVYLQGLQKRQDERAGRGS